MGAVKNRLWLLFSRRLEQEAKAHMNKKCMIILFAFMTAASTWACSTGSADSSQSETAREAQAEGENAEEAVTKAPTLKTEQEKEITVDKDEETVIR